jgi:LuxR family transcriptional regulator, maltose regulon positive regulatory protein
MNAKAIPASTPGQADPPLDASAASQVAMVVMLVPISTPTSGVPPARQEPVPPTYTDSHDHVWLLVDKASPIAAMFQQITAAEPTTMPVIGHVHSSHESSAHISLPLSNPAQMDIAELAAEPLSRREIDVLRLMADGRSNKEIAQALILALSTIKMHVKHIYGKLRVKNRVQAVAQARALGLLTPAMH